MARKSNYSFEKRQKELAKKKKKDEKRLRKLGKLDGEENGSEQDQAPVNDDSVTVAEEGATAE